MIQRLFFILVMLFSSLTVFAQTSLQINKLFDGRYRKLPNAVEIVVTGESANKLKLNMFRSLSVSEDKGVEQEIERLVVKDGAKALDKEAEYREGNLYYGFYRFKSEKKAMNRYVFYLNQAYASKNPVNKVTVIYMESRENADYIRSLIKK